MAELSLDRGSTSSALIRGVLLVVATEAAAVALLSQAWLELADRDRLIAAIAAVVAALLAGGLVTYAVHAERQGRIKRISVSVGLILVVLALGRGVRKDLSDVGMVAFWAAVSGGVLAAGITGIRGMLKEAPPTRPFPNDLPPPPPPPPSQ
jgi:O-antigen/teichoic acid export membrane protein